MNTTKVTSYFSYNSILGISLSILFISLIIFHIIYFHVEISNTGKLLWNPRSYKYIDIKPKENYLELLKPDESNIKTKEITVGVNKITLSYQINDDTQPFFKLLNSKIDQIKLLEYAYRKCFEIMHDKDHPVQSNKNIKLTFKTSSDKGNAGKYAGAYTSADDNIVANNEYLQTIYEETTEKEFIIYYIGLIIHEMSHVLSIDFNDNTERKIIIRENISEYIRTIAGFQRDSWNVTKTYDTTPKPYGAHGVFFLYWINEKYPGFLQKLIQDMYLNKELETHKDITGKTQEELFSEFQKELPYL